jgi:hypothetical protein
MKKRAASRSMGREETVPVCLGSNLSFVNYDIERGVVSVEKERFLADSALPERGAGKVEHHFSLAVTETPKYRGENVVIIFRRSGHSLKRSHRRRAKPASIVVGRRFKNCSKTKVRASNNIAKTRSAASLFP